MSSAWAASSMYFALSGDPTIEVMSSISLSYSVLPATREVFLEEARVGLVQVEHRGQVVGRVDAFQPLLVDGRVEQIGRVVAQHLEGELDVLRRERLAVRPGNARVQLDGYRGEIVVVLEAVRLPW